MEAREHKVCASGAAKISPNTANVGSKSQSHGSACRLGRVGTLSRSRSVVLMRSDSAAPRLRLFGCDLRFQSGSTACGYCRWNTSQLMSLSFAKIFGPRPEIFSPSRDRPKYACKSLLVGPYGIWLAMPSCASGPSTSLIKAALLAVLRRPRDADRRHAEKPPSFGSTKRSGTPRSIRPQVRPLSHGATQTSPDRSSGSSTGDEPG